MGWFGKQPKSRFPQDMLQRMELLGRDEFGGVGRAGVDRRVVVNECMVPFYDDAQRDPEGFLAELRALVAGDMGGFATYGASRLAVEMLGPDCRLPDFLALVDAGLDVTRRRGLPLFSLRGYERQRWWEMHDPGEWESPGGDQAPV